MVAVQKLHIPAAQPYSTYFQGVSVHLQTLGQNGELLARVGKRPPTSPPAKPPELRREGSGGACEPGQRRGDYEAARRLVSGTGSEPPNRPRGTEERTFRGTGRLPRCGTMAAESRRLCEASAALRGLLSEPMRTIERTSR